MLFTKVDISLIVEQSDGKETIEDSHKFIDKIALAGTPVYDSAVTSTTVSGVKNANQIRREFRKK